MTTPRKSLNDVFCLVRVYDETSDFALDQALALAQAKGAYLSLMIAAQKAETPFSLFLSTMTTSIIDEFNASTKSKAEAFAAKARDRAAAMGVNADVAVMLDTVDKVAERAVRPARAFDLIVVDQQNALLDTRGILLEEALFQTGRPVLVASPKCAPVSAVRKIMLAWDGSMHAARALSDALALFPELEAVEIVTISGEKDLGRGLPGADLAHHLARKGVATTLTALELKEGSVATLINDHAVKTDADMIVMGGFGHSRLSQFIFGGVTIELTETAQKPLLMAY